MGKIYLPQCIHKSDNSNRQANYKLLTKPTQTRRTQNMAELNFSIRFLKRSHRRAGFKASTLITSGIGAFSLCALHIRAPHITSFDSSSRLFLGHLYCDQKLLLPTSTTQHWTEITFNRQSGELNRQLNYGDTVLYSVCCQRLMVSPALATSRA